MMGVRCIRIIAMALCGIGRLHGVVIAVYQHACIGRVLDFISGLL